MLEACETAKSSFQVLRDVSTGIKHWYAVQTVPRHEKKVGQQLGMDGLDIFVPAISKESKWSDRTKIVEQPLFPGYIFLLSGDIQNHRKFLHKNRSVLRILSNGTAPAEIPPSEIESIRHVVQARAIASPASYLSLGQRIRILNGALRGLEGILLRVAGENKLIVSVSLIQRSVSISIEGYEIEAL